MKPGNTITNTYDSSLQKAVKIAGLMFLLNFLAPTLNWIFVLSKLIVPGNAGGTTKNILANQILFRTGITIELLMSAGLVALGLALYKILKTANKDLALLGLLLKLIEAAIVAVISLISFIALLADNNTAGILLNAHTAIYAIPMVFLGLDMVIFSFLFLKSKYIPGILAGFGIISFMLIFLHALMYILAPRLAVMPIYQIIFWTPSGLFEILIGTWLLSKGIHSRTQHCNNETM